MASAAPTRFLVMADTHDLDLATLKAVPDIDVVLHRGDLTENGGLASHEKVIQGLGAMPAELKLVIPGNHDVDLDPQFFRQQGGNMKDHDAAIRLWKSAWARDLGVVYLEEGTHKFTLKTGAVFTIYATPYQPEYGISAFQYPSGHDRYNDADATPAWATSAATATSIVPAFPEIDIIMSHGPPKYIRDNIDGRASGGCEHLRRAVCRARPQLHCFGHVHQGWGAQRVLWKGAAKNAKDTILEELEDNQDDDMLPWMEASAMRMRNSRKRKGYAMMDNATDEDIEAGRMEHGRQTLMVNAAIENDQGKPKNTPWVVELLLSGGG